MPTSRALVCIPRCSVPKTAKWFHMCRHIVLLKRQQLQAPSNPRTALAGRHVCLASALDYYGAFSEPFSPKASSLYQARLYQSTSWGGHSWLRQNLLKSTGSSGFRIHVSCHPHSLYRTNSVKNVQQDFLGNQTLAGFIFGTLEIYVTNTFKSTRHHLLSCFSNW